MLFHGFLHSLPTFPSPLASFILGNYRQALEIIGTYPHDVAVMQSRLSEDDRDIDNWPAKEREFLQNLKAEPAERGLQCSYVTALVARQKALYVHLLLSRNRAHLFLSGTRGKPYPLIPSAPPSRRRRRHVPSTRLERVHWSASERTRPRNSQLGTRLSSTWRSS